MDRREFVMCSVLGATALGSAGGKAAVPQAQPPTPPTPASPQQFVSWDAGSGTSRDFWSQKLQLPWAHPGVGDWLDAHQQPQGSMPYATAMVNAGLVELDITALVARWQRNGANRGLYLRSTEPWAFQFAGRSYTVPSERPELRIETRGGVVRLPCTCNATWTPSSYQGTDSRERFEVAQGNHYAALQFDLGHVPQAMGRATLRLHCVALKVPGRLDVFELDPPPFRIGNGALAPQPGIAQAYVYDKGLAHHPDVLFAADFSDLSKTRWQTGSVAAGSTQLKDARSGSTVLRGLIPAGLNQGCDLDHAVVGATAAGVPDRVETELYARYYVYLEDDWGSERDGNKMPGWDGRFGWWNPVGYWQSTTGNGGARPTGLKLRNGNNRWEYQGAAMRGGGGTRSNDGNPYDHLFWLGNYLYHLDQEGDYGDVLPWTGVVIDKGRWHCIEQHIRMNSITGPFDALGNGVAVADGQLTAWMDGVQAYARSQLRWRRHPEMGLQGFWLNWFHGGSATAPRDMHFRMDAVVIARSYIGPRGEA